SAAALEAPRPSVLTPRSLTTTLAPRAPSNSAWARPRPLPAPVTMATLPSKRISSDTCALLLLWRSQGASDDFFHDFVGTAPDAVAPRVQVQPGDRVLGHVAVAAMQLQAGIDHATAEFSSPVLGHRRGLGAQFAA